MFLPRGINSSIRLAIVITLSEVRNPAKITRWAIFLCLFFLPAKALFAEQKPADGLTLDRLGTCNWQVTYRGRTYDLAPLTREALTRPIENDIRYALQRVPEANVHLEKVTSHLKDAKGHSQVASVFLGTMLVSALLRTRDHTDSGKKNYSVAILSSGLLALAGTYFSWRNTNEAKEELVNAVEEFNNHSAYKIEPAGASAGSLD